MANMLLHIVVFWAALSGVAGTFSRRPSMSSAFSSLIERASQMVAPTYWCGSGNRAPSPNALSPIYPHVDSCCRQHDNCPEAINRKECLNGICNESPLLPILSCECERKFQQCLASLTGSRTQSQIPVTINEKLLSNNIQHLYFRLLPSVLSRKCIRVSPQQFYTLRCETDSSGSSKRRCSKVPLTRDKWELVDLKEDTEQEWFQPSPYFKYTAKPTYQASSYYN